KHQHLNINWTATSFYINDNVAATHISYEALVVRKKKIQRLLEMLSTIKILKKSHPDIFDQL
ncbi:2833_t:CDS:1, partial [Funneliformis caledonium]